MMNTFRRLLFSSSAPTPESADKQEKLDTVMRDVAPQSPDTYEDAMEEGNGVVEGGDNHDRVLVAVAPIKPVKVKKAKKSKKAQLVEEDIPSEDLDLSQHLGKIGDIANGLANGFDGNEDRVMGGEIQLQKKTVNGVTSTKKPRKPRNGLSRRDLKLLEQNKENGIVGEEAAALAELNHELLELPVKIKKAKKAKAKAAVLKRGSTPDEPRVDDDDEEADYSALLHQQLTPAKPMPPLHHFSPEEPLEVDGVLLEPAQLMDVDAASAAVKKGRKRAAPASQGEETSRKKLKRGKGKEVGNSDVKAILDSQHNSFEGSESASVSLKELARKTYMEFAEEKSPPPRPSSSFDVIVPVLPGNPIVDLPPSASSKSAADASIARPKKRKSGFTAINVRDNYSASPSELVHKSEYQPEVEVQPEVESQPEIEAEHDHAPPKSPLRKKRRLPVTGVDFTAEAASSQPTSSKSKRKTPRRSRTAAPQSSSQALAVPSSQPQSSRANSTAGGNKITKLTETHRTKIVEAVEAYREMEGLEDSDIIKIVQADVDRSGRNSFWQHVCDEVPDLTRRKVVAYCRRNFHPYERGPWSEEQDDELETIVNRLNDQGTPKNGFWKVAGELLNRYAEDCRDRWRTYATCKNRKVGEWSQDDEMQLREAMRECRELFLARSEGATEADFEPDYTLVSKKMGGSRTRLQCMNKWKAIVEREKAVGDDPVAKAPVSTTAWRIIPALEQARSMSTEEKYQLLTCIRDSGAAREGKIPWTTFPGNRGMYMVWKAFLRGATYSIPDYDEMAFQDRIRYLIDKFDNQEPVEINESATEFAGLAEKHKRLIAKHGIRLSELKVASDDDYDDQDQEEKAEPTRKTLRRRMKKQGESQSEETANGEQDEGEAVAHDKDIDEVIEKIRSSQKTSASTSTLLRTVLNDGREDGLQESEQTPSHNPKKPPAKKLKKAKAIEEVVEDVNEDQEELVNGNVNLEEAENAVQQVVDVQSSLKPRKSKKSKVRRVEEAVEDVNEDYEEMANGSINPDADVVKNVTQEVIDAPSLKPKKNRKSKKTLASEAQDIIQEDVNHDEAVSASISKEKKKKKKAKKSAFFDEVAIEDADDYDYVDPYRSTGSQKQEQEKKKEPKKRKVAEEPVEELIEEAVEDVVDDQEMANGHQEYAEEDEMDVDRFQDDIESSAPDNLEDPWDPIEYTPEPELEEPAAVFSDEEPVAEANEEVEDYDHHDRESLDLDTTGNMIGDFEDLEKNSEADFNGIEDEDLDEDHEITIHGFREPSPELRGTPRGIRESPIPIHRAATPPSGQPQPKEEREKRKHLFSQQEHLADKNGEKKRKKKKMKLDVSEAQSKWKQLQPRSNFMDELDDESSSDGSDSSIPARVRPKISTSDIPAPKARMSSHSAI